MDGLGNDFIIFDKREKPILLSKNQIKKISDRSHTGCDQVIFIAKDKRRPICLPINKEYALNASHNGYLFFSENFLLTEGNASEPFQKDVAMHKIEVNKTMVLKNVFFINKNLMIKVCICYVVT